MIEESNTGVLIKDPSELILRKNHIQKNNIQVEMEKKSAKKFWNTYYKEVVFFQFSFFIPLSYFNLFLITY